MQTSANLKIFHSFEKATVRHCPADRGNALVLGDKFVITAAVTVMLKHFGIKTKMTADIPAAMKLLCSNPGGFEIVIAEQGTQDMLHSPLVRETIGIRPDIPILLATGDHNAIFCRRIKTIESLELLRKPVELSELFENLESLRNRCHAGRKEYVMVLEDQYPITRTVKNVMEHLGFETVTVGNRPGRVEACRILAVHSCLVVTDQSSMSSSGSPLLREIADVAPDTPILLGANDHQALLCRHIRQIEDFELVSGPADYHALLCRIRNLISLLN